MQEHPLIRQIGDPILHRPGKQADFVKDAQEIQKQISILEKCRKATGGIGIAANQCVEIEDPLAIVIVGIDADDKAAEERYKNIDLPNKFFLINPRITDHSIETQKLEGGEGCLSVMGCVRGDITRQADITISYYDSDGSFHENKKFTGMTAIIIQHELSHILKGQVYLENIIQKLTKEQKTELKKTIETILNGSRIKSGTTSSVQDDGVAEREHIFIENNGKIEFEPKKVEVVFKTLSTQTLTGIDVLLRP